MHNKFTVGTQCDHLGLDQIGVGFIKALADQWKGSSHPNAPVETMDTMAEESVFYQIPLIRTRGPIGAVRWT